MTEENNENPLDDFYKTCERMASQQTTRLDQLVAEACDLIIEDHHSDDPTSWDKATADLQLAMRQETDRVSKLAQMFALIGMMEVSRRMLED